MNILTEAVVGSLVGIALLGMGMGIGYVTRGPGEPPETPPPVVQTVEVEVIREVIVDRVVEVVVTPEPVTVMCWFAVSPPSPPAPPMINIPLINVGRPPPDYTGILGYLCSDTMLFRAGLPEGAQVLNVEAHVGSVVGRGVDDGN